MKSHEPLHAASDSTATADGSSTRFFGDPWILTSSDFADIETAARFAREAADLLDKAAAMARAAKEASHG